jgi:ribosomal-protein-serine acetyltransferase
VFQAEIDESTNLVPLELRHADEIFQAVDEHRDDLREWLPWVDGTRTADDVREFLRNAIEERESGDGVIAGFWQAGQFAGVFGLHAIDYKNACTSIGYWLAPPFRGRGYMTKACRLVLDHAFNELKLNRVVIQCAVENLKSRAVPARLGFMQEGILRQAEKLPRGYVDIVVYGMLAEEWNSADDATFI